MHHSSRPSLGSPKIHRVVRNTDGRPIVGKRLLLTFLTSTALALAFGLLFVLQASQNLTIEFRSSIDQLGNSQLFYAAASDDYSEQDSILNTVHPGLNTVTFDLPSTFSNQRFRWDPIDLYSQLRVTNISYSVGPFSRTLDSDSLLPSQAIQHVESPRASREFQALSNDPQLLIEPTRNELLLSLLWLPLFLVWISTFTVGVIHHLCVTIGPLSRQSMYRIFALSVNVVVLVSLVIWQRSIAVDALPNDDALLMWRFFEANLQDENTVAGKIMLMQGEFHSLLIFAPFILLDAVGLLTFANLMSLASLLSLAIGPALFLVLRAASVHIVLATVASLVVMLGSFQLSFQTFYIPMQHSTTMLFSLIMVLLFMKVAYGSLSPARTNLYFVLLGLGASFSWIFREPATLLMLTLSGAALVQRSRIGQWRARILSVVFISGVIISAVWRLMSPGLAMMESVPFACTVLDCQAPSPSPLILIVVSTVLWGVAIGLWIKRSEKSTFPENEMSDAKQRRWSAPLVTLFVAASTVVLAPSAFFGFLFAAPGQVPILQSISNRWLVYSGPFAVALVLAVVWVVLAFTKWASSSAALLVSLMLLGSTVYLLEAYGSLFSTPFGDGSEYLYLARYSVYLAVPMIGFVAIGINRWYSELDAPRLYSRNLATGVLLLVILFSSARWVATFPQDAMNELDTKKSLNAYIAVDENLEVSRVYICTVGVANYWSELSLEPPSNKIPQEFNFPSLVSNDVEELVAASSDSAISELLSSSSVRPASERPADGCATYIAGELSVT